MFGPNNLPYNHHHREDKFKVLYSNFQKRFQETFGLEDYIILPITGSGTIALEILLNSLNIKLEHLYTDLEFGARFEALNHSKKGRDGVAYVQYETSIGKYQESDSRKPVIIDAVSSFPYYNIPLNASAFVTVNSKQLGCNPGLSIIGVKPELLKKVKPEEFSYLSLKKYLNYSKINQTPNTPAISLIEELYNALEHFDLEAFRKTLDSRREDLDNIFPHNTGEGPVFTLDMDKELKNKYNLYGKQNTQIFLWSGTQIDFDHFINNIKGDLK